MAATSGKSGRAAPQPGLRLALIIGALIVLGLLVWQLSHVLLLAFAAVLTAVLLRALAGQFERVGWIRPPWSVLLSALVIALVLTGLIALLGAQAYAEITGLAAELPGRIDAVGEQLGIADLREQLISRLQETGAAGGVLGQTASYTFAVLNAAATLVVVIVAGIFIAIKPALHRDGALALIPEEQRKRARAAFNEGGRALRLWLLGQLAAMVLVGLLTGIGLAIIGVPSAIGLGLIAGLFEFVPVFGPILAAVPALLMALSEGGTTALWTLLLFIVIQQLEGNVIQPLIQRRAVDLPPVLLLFSILVFGILFGALGVILAAPLAVLAFVFVKELYMRGVLGEETDVPGED